MCKLRLATYELHFISERMQICVCCLTTTKLRHACYKLQLFRAFAERPWGSSAIQQASSRSQRKLQARQRLSHASFSMHVAALPPP